MKYAILFVMLISILVSAIKIMPARAESQTITVPDDYARIQDAIDAANSGDMILVKSGTYHEQLIINKTVRLVGESPETTAIIGDNENAVIVQADGVEVANFTVSAIAYHWYDRFDAIHVFSANNCSFVRNRVVSSFCGIVLQEADNTIVCDNLLDSNNEGVTLANSSYNAIQENMFINNSKAIRLMDSSSNNTIHDNDIVDTIRDSVIIQSSSNGNAFFKNNMSCVASTFPFNTTGIAVLLSSYNRVYENLVTNVTYACVVCMASYNLIYKNTIAGNVIGVESSCSSYNEIYSNNVVENEVGFLVYPVSMHNLIHHNNFINNTNQTQLDWNHPNYWDNNYPSGGNYWSDYDGADEYSGPSQNETGSDGIGDTPYVLTGTNVDNYPLVSPANLFEAFTPQPMPERIEIVSNSTISGFEVNMTDGRIRFEVSGENGTGYCRITIPNTIVYGVWGGNHTVLVDGVAPLRVENWTDHTNTYIYFTYHHSQHEVIIIPESPLIAILPLLISTMILVLSFKRKQRR
jgi:parallel beta-helix repeat protein